MLPGATGQMSSGTLLLSEQNAAADLAVIQDELGEVPLVGFFCNGEISHNRVYGHTGVLSLFL